MTPFFQKEPCRDTEWAGRNIKGNHEKRASHEISFVRWTPLINSFKRTTFPSFFHRGNSKRYIAFPPLPMVLHLSFIFYGLFINGVIIFRGVQTPFPLSSCHLPAVDLAPKFDLVTEGFYRPKVKATKLYLGWSFQGYLIRPYQGPKYVK